jgi:hypothetical protein
MFILTQIIISKDPIVLSKLEKLITVTAVDIAILLTIAGPVTHHYNLIINTLTKVTILV